LSAVVQTPGEAKSDRPFFLFFGNIEKIAVSLCPLTNFLILFYIIMNIYVGNLHYDVTGDELKEIFEEYGEVDSAKVITDKYSGRSKGFGFVEMKNDNEALKSIDELNGADIKGRNIKVSQARPREY
jgi:hypothetical protein